ncbi:hypothetical protein HPG69_009170, partial [Diceros bicornis minor]
RPSTEGGRTAGGIWTAALVRISGAEALLTEGGTEQAAATMEPPSAPAHRGRSHWKWLMLAGRSGNIPGPTYSSREMIFVNGSLQLKKVTQKDTGYYTLQIIKKDFLIKVGTGQLRVYITEHKDAVVLICLTNDTRISIQWFLPDHSLLLTERVKLSQDNSTLTKHPIRREDPRNY